MHENLLMNCLWYEKITPEELANVLEITPEALFGKIFRNEGFTQGEIRRMVGLLGRTEEETERIFFG